ncbi:MAG TPA: hypothetical protein VHL09_00035 [Dehalococcoidia bacterium]|nr:hypothetical protein [Dehalococcoidia bacterium]
MKARGQPARPEIRAFFAWRRAGGPYGRLVFAAPFFGRLEGDPRPRSARGAAARLARLLPAALSPDEAVIVDLDPRLTLAAVPALRRLTDYVIPLIGRWPAEPAVLPVGPVLALLVDHAPGPRERRPAGGSPVFLLDGGRAGPVGGVSARQLARRFDNRYAYQIDYLPPADGLVEAGINRVVWICESGQAASDVAEYATRLARAGLAIDYRRATTRS